jgi:hypothetical protein
VGFESSQWQSMIRRRRLLGQALSHGFTIDPVCKAIEALRKLGPECQPLADRGRDVDCAEAGDMFVTNFPAVTAGFDQARLKPISGLTEANEHVVALSHAPRYRESFCASSPSAFTAAPVCARQRAPRRMLAGGPKGRTH